jgi:two-component system NtrC family response regulator
VDVDARVVASTHRDLAGCVRDGTFRRDLYHRIAGTVVRVPPLRERPEDILPLARHFARLASSSSSSSSSAMVASSDAAAASGGERRGSGALGLELEAARLLVEHDWPGNARELQHVVARAVALADGPVIQAEHLPPELHASRGGLPHASLVLAMDESYRDAKRSFDQLYFQRLLERTKRNLSEAARESGLTRSHLYNRLDELGLR